MVRFLFLFLFFQPELRSSKVSFSIGIEALLWAGTSQERPDPWGHILSLRISKAVVLLLFPNRIEAISGQFKAHGVTCVPDVKKFSITSDDRLGFILYYFSAVAKPGFIRLGNVYFFNLLQEKNFSDLFWLRVTVCGKFSTTKKQLSLCSTSLRNPKRWIA